MYRTFTAFLAFVLIFSAIVTLCPGAVVINEIMYHPASENLLESYIEVYNSDAATADLSGWRFTKGIPFVFPTNTSLPGAGYLVVAADRAAFTNKYPGVTNFVAGWAGTMGSHLRLEDAGGQVVSEVEYSNDGDWADRLLTTNGFAAFGHLGWEWYAPPDGLGSSLELINASLAVGYAQNWGASTASNGTPGQANSIARTNVAPFIVAVAHAPIVPQPTDVVTVSARLVDEHATGLTATIYYRNATTPNPPAFANLPMFDDGAHNDGLAGDGIYSAILPAQPAGTVVEFYLQASDVEANERIYPAVIPPTNSLRTANLLYQVDTGTYAGAQPVYRVIMTETEREELYAIGRGCPDSDSDAQMNATWITMDGVTTGGTSTQLRYNTGVRNRGHGSRTSNPNNYHVNIPGDRAWKNTTGINLNSQYAYCQVVGSAVFRRLAMAMPESRAVQVRINSTNVMSLPGLPNNNSFGSYAANEQYNNDFVKRSFALDPAGNSYRGIRDASLCNPSLNGVADLTWQGANYAVAAYTNAYFKQNHLLENDWSDLITLLAVLNNTNGFTTAGYATNVASRLDVDEWMRYLAINTLLDNDETCLANGIGDDYALYRGTADPRFQALPYDLDDLLGLGLTALPPRHDLWRMTALPVMDRFMKTPEFAPAYFRWLKAYADTFFAPAQMNPLLDQQMNSFVPQATIDTMKAFNAAQVSNVLAQIPLVLSVSNGLPVLNGFPRSTIPSATLFGLANAIDTRTVLVNGSAAAWTPWRGTWTNTLALFPGINRVLVQTLDGNGLELARTNVDLWYDNGSAVTTGGTIAADTTWTAAGGPYNLTTSLTIASPATLTIQPGTTVYLGSGVNLTVANGGRLLAEGNVAAPIRFTAAPGSGVSWGGMVVNGGVGSPETRIAYAFLDGNSATCLEVAGGTLYLDHTSFGTTAHQYVALDSASFLISSCFFPSSTAPFELLHGTGGIKAGGWGIVRDSYFGTTTGNNDIMDYTGGNRDLGQPIIQYYNNVFIGASDDILDLDGTDAWIEGNIFLHAHQDPVHTAFGTSSAISGGNNGADTSEITIIGNVFYDCDNVAMAKQGNFFTLLNNTVVHQSHQGSSDTDGAVVALADESAAEALGMYLEANLVYDAEKLVRNWTNAILTFSNNLLPFPWTGSGGGNATNNPLLKRLPQLSETFFTTFAQAQVMRDWFSLLPGSPARGAGPNGRDLGGIIPLGASVAGEPMGTNNQTTATLSVGLLRSGFGIPASGWPDGSGYPAYKWRLDGGAWSSETSSSVPILLTGLANGPHHVEVTGKRDSGWYQDDPAFGPDSVITTSRTWTVDTSFTPPVRPTVRLNEILAQNSTTLTNAGATPDLIELYNFGASAVDLSGVGLTDTASLPFKYTFPPGTPLLGPGQFLVLFADSLVSPGIHLGFSLKASGDDIYLHASSASGGALLDSVVFGVQAADLSIGRAVDGTWAPCRPTFGANNVVLGLGDPHGLKINEWLADGLFLANTDFVELFNPGTQPIALGGCYLSNAEGAPALNPISALSFIAPNGYTAFTANGDPSQGADHLNFKLDPEVGIILLADSALSAIDEINYGPQVTDVAQGRSPNGSDIFVSFLQPTPGAPNPVPNGTLSVTNITSLTVNLLNFTNYWRWDNSGGTNLGTTWFQTVFGDSSWSNGLPLFGFETTPAEYAPYLFQTYIPPVNTNGGHITTYYRTHFQWNAGLTNFTLISTNYVDDGAAYYLNGVKVGSLRLPAVLTYNTLATQNLNEAVQELLTFPTNSLVVGDNVMAVELHQNATGSSDGVFGMWLSAVQLVTNITTITVGVPVVLNEVLASNRSLTNLGGLTADWVELLNTSTNPVSLANLSLSDDPNVPRKFVFSPGTMIPPHGSLVCYCNNTLPVSATNTGFSLNASGGAVYFFGNPINGGLIDSVAFGLQTPDFSIGRVPNGSGTWILNVPSPGALNEAAGLGSVSSLSVNEWMADPASGSDWFELYDGGVQPVSLGGLFFTDDLTKKTQSPMPPLSFIGVGANGFVQFFADSSPLSGADHVDFKLSKSGEAVALFSGTGLLITGINFGAQTTGISQGHFPDGSTNVVSFNLTASPGESNFLPLSNAVVNEILTHTDLPLEDALELYNPSLGSVNISGWFISNSRDNLKKFRIADGTLLPAQGFKVLYQYQFNPTNGSSLPFTFNSAHGDEAWLSAADAAGNLSGFRSGSVFGPAANGVSFGRYTNSVGLIETVAMSARSFGVDNPASVTQFRTGQGELNPYPLVGPVVINEIMFDPPSLDGTADNTQDEYLELQNISSYSVPLFDPAQPGNTWKIQGGVDFTFPPNIALPAQGFLLVVNFDPLIDLPALAEFRVRYGLGPNVPIFGPYGGHLANSGESLSLFRPDAPQSPPHPDAGFVPYVLIEHVEYFSGSPWPVGAAGTGSSLQRLVPANYGNDPVNWFVAAPTAARVNAINPADTDGDGLPDAWEIQYFGAINDPRATPNADPDGDGFSNLQEFIAGTDPLDAHSYLRIASATVSSGVTSIQFSAVAGKSYSILYRTEVSDGTWFTLTNVPPQGVTGSVTVTDPIGGVGATRFYRLVTPEQP